MKQGAEADDPLTLFYYRWTPYIVKKCEGDAGATTEKRVLTSYTGFYILFYAHVSIRSRPLAPTTPQTPTLPPPGRELCSPQRVQGLWAIQPHSIDIIILKNDLYCAAG